MVTRMREKGQVTIPAGIRESLHLSKNSILSVAKVGGGILLTPKPSVYEAASARFVKAAEEKGITLDDLLKDLKKIRHKDS
ncbi:MAG: AbrB/MazE/SpoVT family DNA-binding domain-containing protein [Elusimicrobia bacterium]|nr:AbrB/MazE/SpoVT family DNA-binding domain-containing protein [Elusimicrobiota bacterium]